MLEVQDLHVSYGPVPAVRGVSLSVGQGKVVAVLGRNGAGKTTTMKAIAGLLRPTSGSVRFDDHVVTGANSDRRLRAGLALVPEGRGMFPDLTVFDSLRMGAFHRRLKRDELAAEVERVTESFPQLRERLDQRSGSLSGGEQQMLAVARSMLTQPKLIVLDEPSLGLAPIAVEELYALLGTLRDSGLSMLVVEQYVELALRFADEAFVLDKGEVVLTGVASDLASAPEVVEAYLSSARDSEVA